MAAKVAATSAKMKPTNVIKSRAVKQEAVKKCMQDHWEFERPRKCVGFRALISVCDSPVATLTTLDDNNVRKKKQFETALVCAGNN